MNVEENMKKILSDQAFVKSLLEMKTIEEAQEAFKKKGIEIEKKDLKTVGDFLANCVKGKSNKLNDGQLATVSGGTNAIVRFVGKTLSFPFTTVGYTMGAILAGFPRGIYDGFNEAWYYDEGK